MRPNEARYVERLLGSLASESISPCLNIGSSTAHFRTVEQPHVDAHVFRPLRERGVPILNLDIKEDAGVDLVGDVLDLDFQTQVGALRPRLVMCSNLLEHLTDPIAFAHACARIVQPGGYLLITGPYSYPYHLDPIDTLYRPGPDEIRRLFPDFSCLHGAIVPDSTYLHDLLSQNNSRQLIRLIIGHVLKFPYLLLVDFERFKARYHRYFWLFRRYTSTVVLLYRPSHIDHVAIGGIGERKMPPTQKADSGSTFSEKYSVGNPSRRGLYLTCDSNPLRLKPQLAYIAARRALFALQNRPAPALKTDVLVSRRHAAIIVTIPKSGSRSLMAAFLGRWSEPEGVWPETTSLDSMSDRGWLRGDYCVLAVVRNPWDRAYSCYRDKIARLDRMRRRAHLIARYRGLRPFMPFDAFVEWLGSDEGADEWADRHWASQSAFLRVRNDYRCDHLFKLEQLADQTDRLRSVLTEPDLHIPQINIVGNTKARRDVYNGRTRAIIARRYEEDIDRFKYVF